MLVLASASPRRQELIKLIDEQIIICPSDADESYSPNTPAGSVPEMLAVRKAAEVAKKYPKDTVIGCDTSVIIEGEILGKPSDKDDAKRMLGLLSGKTHKVITGCAIFKSGKSISFSESTEVTFYPLSDKDIEDYIATNEPFDKAGAYGIQGKGSLLIKGINGDYFNVVGLPVAKLNKVLKMI
ncbi:MAG: septum formation inhibitor Maf [Clostridia bacterium]|nr:septum formation inhibitor Maf [Clostridia bacterium]